MPCVSEIYGWYILHSMYVGMARTCRLGRGICGVLAASLFVICNVVDTILLLRPCAHRRWQGIAAGSASRLSDAAFRLSGAGGPDLELHQWNGCGKAQRRGADIGRVAASSDSG